MCINASFLTTHHYHSLLQVMKNRLPCLTQPRERPCGIGGACGRKHCRFDSSNRKLVPFIKLPCLVSVCINLCHVRFFQNHANVRWLYIFNTAVARAFDVTTLDHIPQGNPVGKQPQLSPGPAPLKVLQALSRNGSVCARNKNCFLLI